MLSVLLIVGAAVSRVDAASHPAHWRGAAATDKPVNVPTWTPEYAARFPGCDRRHRLGDVVVVGLDNRARRVGFDRAWHLAHDRSRADDVWVVGWCG